MTKLNDIMSTPLNDFKDLAHMLEVLWRRGDITLNQWRVAATALAEYLPAHVNVTQRTPKSVTYFHALGKAVVKVSNRAKVTVEYSYLQK